MKKNDKIQLTIEDMSVNGEGIGHADGMACFVKDAVIGDKIIAGITKVKKTYCYARVVEVLEPSAQRSTPMCPKSKPCGGCQLQALSYESQLQLKANHVRSNLIRVGGFSEEFIDNIMEPIIGMEEPFYYRNKLQIPVGHDKNGDVVMGFYLAHSHDIVPIDTCYLSHHVIDSVAGIIRQWIVDNKVSVYENNKGILRHVLIRYGYTSKEIMVCLIGNLDYGRCDNRFKSQLSELVSRLETVEGMTSIVFNENRKNTNVILGDKTSLIWGKETIVDYIGDIAFNISAKSFYQVNPTQTYKLYSKALEYAMLTGEEHLWDLYCGIGTIGLFMSGKAKSVFGVEVVPQAIEDAKGNAKLNDIDNAEFVVGKAEDVIRVIKWSNAGDGADYKQQADDGLQVGDIQQIDTPVGVYKREGETIQIHKPDVIVVDPPRKGCDENCINTILELEPKRVVYVSCNPSTLARDLVALCESKYKLEAVTPVDMFPHTGHVETVALLSQQYELANK